MVPATPLVTPDIACTKSASSPKSRLGRGKIHYQPSRANWVHGPCSGSPFPTASNRFHELREGAAIEGGSVEARIEALEAQNIERGAMTGKTAIGACMILIAA